MRHTWKLIGIALILLLATQLAFAVDTVGRKRCGGFAGTPCPGKLVCVDDPSDSCDPKKGHADCIGICVPGSREALASETDLGVSPIDEAVAQTSDVTECASDTELGKGKGCKPCKKDRRWCGCTYQGMPRASCDPCCYTNDIGVLTCLD